MFPSACVWAFLVDTEQLTSVRDSTASGDLQPPELSLPAFLVKIKDVTVVHRAAEIGENIG